LNDLNTSSTRCISTGLEELDLVLQSRDPAIVPESNAFPGGISRGKVTEVWGPSGVGKTALGYVNDLRDENEVKIDGR
jgi:RecA/RadA recombinase